MKFRSWRGENEKFEDLFHSFSGIVNFYPWNSRTLISSYIIDEGVIKRKSNDNITDILNARTDCYSFTVYYYTAVYTIYGSWYSYDYSETHNYCVYTPDQYLESDLPPEYYGGGGGGASGGISDVPGDTPQLQAFEEEYKTQMTQSELQIYNTMDRFQQVAYLLNAQNALYMAQSLYPNLSQLNDKADAFRHAYFSLLNVIDLGVTLAEMLGSAHEDFSDNPVDQRFMDLYNNQEGRNAYQDWYNAGGVISMSDIIQGLVDSGELVIIKNGSILPSNE